MVTSGNHSGPGQSKQVTTGHARRMRFGVGGVKVAGVEWAGAKPRDSGRGAGRRGPGLQADGLVADETATLLRERYQASEFGVGNIIRYWGSWRCLDGLRSSARLRGAGGVHFLLPAFCFPLSAPLPSPFALPISRTAAPWASSCPRQRLHEAGDHLAELDQAAVQPRGESAPIRRSSIAATR